MLKIFISAGEHSGDLLGAHLIRALKNELDTRNHIDFQGIESQIHLLQDSFD